MSKHTPGPWHTNTDEMARWPEQVGCCPLTGRPYSIAVGARNVAAACTAADALLIAAAPDLLEALTLAEDYLRNCCGSAKIANFCKAAIAKAQGDQDGTR